MAMELNRNDMLMKLVRSNGQALDAECSASIASSDDLMDDFAAGKFFEIVEFAFGAGLSDTGNADAKPSAGRKYPVDIEAVSFTRPMDRGSTTIFADLCGLKTFDSATLVKRCVVGDEKGMHAYLRIDFTGVLMIGLDWEEDEVVKETYKFVCRGVSVTYRPQNRDGSLGAAISGVWPASS